MTTVDGRSLLGGSFKQVLLNSTNTLDIKRVLTHHDMKQQVEQFQAFADLHKSDKPRRSSLHKARKRSKSRSKSSKFFGPPPTGS